MNTLKITEADLLPHKATENLLVAEYNGEFILLTVAEPNGFVRNKYTIDNSCDEFEKWCVENRKVNTLIHHEWVPETDSVERENEYILTELQDCRADADLLVEYAIEQIKSDFQI